MNTWSKIRKQKISEGHSTEAAYNLATTEMNKRRKAFNPNSIIGLNENLAKELMDKNGYYMRVVKRDVGVVNPINLDWRPTRYDVSIVEGNVKSIINIG